MKMKHLIITGFLGLFLTSLMAQTPQDRAAETKATELLKQASAKIRSYNTLEIDFAYEMANTAMNINEKMTGKVWSKGDRYYMKVGDNVFISDGKTVWNYLDDLEEVHINTVDNADGGITPTGLMANFEKDFRGKYIRQETFQGKRVDIIDLVPNTAGAFFKYRLALDASSLLPAYITAHDRQGGTFTYTFNQIKPNVNVPDSRFVFNIKDFPGADIIDLR